MLLITDQPVAEKPFHDEIKKVTWETSYLRTWLNEEFFNSLNAVEAVEQEAQPIDFKEPVDYVVVLKKGITSANISAWNNKIHLTIADVDTEIEAYLTAITTALE